jgi:hypothetical protein
VANFVMLSRPTSNDRLSMTLAGFLAALERGCAAGLIPAERGADGLTDKPLLSLTRR